MRILAPRCNPSHTPSNLDGEWAMGTTWGIKGCLGENQDYFSGSHNRKHYVSHPRPTVLGKHGIQGVARTKTRMQLQRVGCHECRARRHQARPHCQWYLRRTMWARNLPLARVRPQTPTLHRCHYYLLLLEVLLVVLSLQQLVTPSSTITTIFTLRRVEPYAKR